MREVGLLQLWRIPKIVVFRVGRFSHRQIGKKWQKRWWLRTVFKGSIGNAGMLHLDRGGAMRPSLPAGPNYLSGQI
jgi:hypothetical protein